MAVLGTAGLVGWRMAAAPTSGTSSVMAIVGGFTAVGMLLAVWQYLPELVPWVLGGLAVVYVIGLPGHAGSAAQAAGYGLGMLLVAEAAYESYDQVTTVRGEPGTQRQRIARLGGVLAAALILDEVAFGAAGLSAGGELLLAAAVVSVVLLIGLVAVLVARQPPDS